MSRLDMKVLIIGASGMLAKPVIEQLDKVVAADLG